MQAWSLRVLVLLATAAVALAAAGVSRGRRLRDEGARSRSRAYSLQIEASTESTLRPAGPLVGRFVRVEPLEERHREGLRAAAAEDPDVFRYMAYPGDHDRWFDQALAATGDVAFAVIWNGSEAGSTRYLNYEPAHYRVEIGWTWLRPSAWGTGANVETKLLLLEHAFERCSLRRVEFKTDSRNERTRGALLALGAQFEGIFRKHMIVQAGQRDSAWYSIVDDDWPEVKARLLWRLEAAAS